jgi:hypothetical protein
MATNFSVRIETIQTGDNSHVIAWIDKDGLVCIEQPFNPENSGQAWESEEEATTWANAHAEMLNNQVVETDPMKAINEKLDAISKALKI